MSLAPKERVYKPVWFCIYCSDGRVRKATKGKLGAEHIIPYGLGGVAILPRASCKKCGRITGKIEETCQHMMLGATRIRMKLPTRNPDDRPKELMFTTVHRDGRTEQKKVPADEFPLLIPGLKLPPPGILSGEKPTNRLVGEFWVTFPAEDIRERLEKLGGAALHLTSSDNHVFSRMLAKIAHSFVVAEWGFHTFVPLLLPLIVGNSQTASHWVGGTGRVGVRDSGGLHRIEIKREVILGTEYVIAYLTLFCMFGAPEYRIVVGTWKGGH